MSADVYFGNSLSEKVIDGEKHHCIRCGGDGTSDDEASMCAITNELCLPQSEYDAFPLGTCDNGLPRWELDRKKRKPGRKQAGAPGKPPQKKRAGARSKPPSTPYGTAKKGSKPPAKKQ